MSLGERAPSEGVVGENRLLSEGGNTWLEPVVKSFSGCSKPRGCSEALGRAAVSSRSKLIFCIGGAPAKDAGSGQQMLAGDSGASLMAELLVLGAGRVRRSPSKSSWFNEDGMVGGG